MSSEPLPATARVASARRLAFGSALVAAAALALSFAGSLGTYFWVAVGSALGGMARFWCGEVAFRLAGPAFPWGTLFINILGSFVIGLFGTLTGPNGRFLVEPTGRHFVMAGLCGGYTTFSAFSWQTLNLINDGEWLRAGGNVVGSVVLCLAAVWAGHVLALGLDGMKGP
ncbi:MAG: fluoride efflux transporter CrcB [Hyphomicrobiales bacterium]|nr:fluoride efflux transporter CrcB [Hyphomicrobiales bacterium]MBV8823869.1 fluoride efflux transporter CrcB [Hyphomicrobiales bacterium]